MLLIILICMMAINEEMYFYVFVKFYVRQLEETGPTNMMKLLSGEYEREWHTKMDALKLDESKPEKTATDTSDFNTNNNNQK